MKQIAAALVVICFLCGCSKENRDLERALALRQRILGAESCRFEAEITADYGDKLYSFTSICQTDDTGTVTFSVAKPDTIAGITGTIADSGGRLSFDDSALCFPLMAEDALSPVSAPWVVMKTLRSGYLTSVGEDDGLLRLTIDDCYQEDALQLDIWVNGEDQPVLADILHNGSRILSVKVKDFQIL